MKVEQAWKLIRTKTFSTEQLMEWCNCDIGVAAALLAHFSRRGWIRCLDKNSQNYSLWKKE